jgi:hypothetical protein
VASAKRGAADARIGTIAAMRPGCEPRHPLGVILVALAVAVGLAACGSSTASTTSSTTNVLAQTRQRLERAVSGDARRNARHYWKGRFHFVIDTKCRPTTSDADNWACRTTVSSPRPMTTTCRIKTKVHGTESAFRFDAPLPFAQNVFSEGCPTLHSELANG